MKPAKGHCRGNNAPSKYHCCDNYHCHSSGLHEIVGSKVILGEVKREGESNGATQTSKPHDELQKRLYAMEGNIVTNAKANDEVYAVERFDGWMFSHSVKVEIEYTAS
jgi:hypothetical protein